MMDALEQSLRADPAGGRSDDATATRTTAAIGTSDRDGDGGGAPDRRTADDADRPAATTTAPAQRRTPRPVIE